MVLKNDLSGYNAFKLNCHLSYLWFSWTQLSNMISRLLSSFGSGVRKMNRRKYHHHILLVISGFTKNRQRKSPKAQKLWIYKIVGIILLVTSRAKIIFLSKVERKIRGWRNVKYDIFSCLDSFHHVFDLVFDTTRAVGLRACPVTIIWSETLFKRLWGVIRVSGNVLRVAGSETGILSRTSAFYHWSFPFIKHRSGALRVLSALGSLWTLTPDPLSVSYNIGLRCMIQSTHCTS